MAWHIGGVELESRFFLGTAGYPSPVVLQQAIAASGAQVGTAVADESVEIARCATLGQLPHRAGGGHAGADGARAVRYTLDQAGSGGR